MTPASRSVPPDPAEACRPLSVLAARRAGQMAGTAGGVANNVAVWPAGGAVSPPGLAVMEIRLLNGLVARIRQIHPGLCVERHPPPIQSQ